MNLIQLLNENAGAITALATIAILSVTTFYAWTTYALFREARQTRLLAAEPRVVAYLRPNAVHSNIVQLYIANLAGAAAVNVSAKIEKLTSWPVEFYFEESKILRDITFLSPHEILSFDLGVGPDLFQDGEPAVFKIYIDYSALDGRSFVFESTLKVESVEGHSQFVVYTIDDVARRLKEIVSVLKGFTGFQRLRVETYSREDRELERRRREEERELHRQRQNPAPDNND